MVYTNSRKGLKMNLEKLKKYDVENILRNGLILLTFISLIIVMLNFTYLVYQDRNIDSINAFLIRYINGPLLWIDNILLYIFAVLYIIAGIQSKKEVVLKVSFSMFSILTTMISITLIINAIAKLFGMF